MAEQQKLNNVIISTLKEIQKDAQLLENENEKLKNNLFNRELLQFDRRRSLHWVLKVGNLKKSVDFFCAVFGMKVLRHEEFDEGCDAKCNGDFNRPWSKTMIGYGDETRNFALELTYNYGIKGYRRGNDLKYIGLMLTKDGFKNATNMGYKPVPCDDTKLFYDIIGPDDFKIRCKLTNINSLPCEPFWSIALNVTDLHNTWKYWCGVLQMQTIEYSKAKYLRASYGGQVPMEFYELKDIKLDHAKAAGRIAFSMDIDKGPFVMNEYMKNQKEKYIVHTKPITLSTPGKADVDVVILQDVDQYEICFTNYSGFKELCTTKSGDEKIDWNVRSQKGADQDKGRFIK